MNEVGHNQAVNEYQRHLMVLSAFDMRIVCIDEERFRLL